MNIWSSKNGQLRIYYPLSLSSGIFLFDFPAFQAYRSSNVNTGLDQVITKIAYRNGLSFIFILAVYLLGGQKHAD